MESHNLCKILFVGRLDTPKNPIMALQVMSEIVKYRPNVTLTIVGDGEKYNECQEYINKKNLSFNVELVGWQNNVGEFYKSHDIFMMTSIYEAFGLIFVEAGYNKLPIIATNVEGIPEVVIHGKTGLLSPPNDIEQMVKNCLYLIDHPCIRNSFGENGYNRVTTMFSSNKMAKQYIDLYESKK